MSSAKNHCTSIVGNFVTIVGSTDPTKLGRRGEVVLETCKTLVLDSPNKGRRRGPIRVEKNGTVLEVEGSKTIIDGRDTIGRLEDRLGSRRGA